MAKKSGYDFLDYIIVFEKNKKKILSITFISMVIGYILIYFLIPPQFESKALIVAKEESSVGLMGSISKALSDLPLGSFGFSTSSSDKYDLFQTLLYSRTNLEDLISKYDLMNDYNQDEIEKALKILEKSISLDKTEANALVLAVSASSPEKSANMTNYIVETINKKIVDLNVKKSRENRIFIGERLSEIKDSLAAYENQMEAFQEKYDLLDVESQVKIILETYSDIESDIVQKEIQLDILEKMFGKSNPQYTALKFELNLLQDRFNTMKKAGKENSLLLPINDLPKRALEYLRLYRKIEINNKMLEFVIPLFEQARFEEVKDIPSLTVIDHAVPPEKKNYPPRTIFTLLIGFFVGITSTSYLFVKSLINNSESEKINYLKNSLFKFRK